MCDAGNRGAGRGEPDEGGALGAPAAGWLATASGLALRERLAIQLGADTEKLRLEVGAGGRLMARFQVRGVAFEVAFPDDFPRDQPVMRWRVALGQHWLPLVDVEPPADAVTAEARAFAFLEVVVPRVVAEVAAQEASRGATASPPIVRKRRRARRLAVETVIIAQRVPDEPDGGGDPGG